jgi:cellulose biosynthesis protein BcsQ
MTIRISVVNHKGGVGKTTLVWHLAAILAEENYSVLCVDADPQCNLSTIFLGEAQLDRLLDSSSKRTGRTLWSLLAGSRPTESVVFDSRDRSGPKLIPGDVEIYRFEEMLAQAWGEHRERPTESLEVLTRLGRRLERIEREHQIDFVLIDTAPSLGALNRTIVLESDFVLVPLTTDLFSVRGLRTLGRGMVEWMTKWNEVTRFAPSDLLTRSGRPVLAGYVLRLGHKFKSSDVARVQTRVGADLIQVLKRFDKHLVRGGEFDLRLGTIPQIDSMSMTQDSRQPIWSTQSKTKKTFDGIANRLLNRVRKMRGGRK